MSPTTVREPLIATARTLLERPLLELVFEAAQVHREHHDPRRVQLSQLLSVKTGGCSEDCGYCAQSARFQTEVEREELLPLELVVEAAQRAKDGGADRFCLGAAWRSVRSEADFERVLEMVRAVKELGLEACATLGAIDPDQAERLAAAGLDFYNHNLDTGREHYPSVVSTHDYDERLDTLQVARDAGLRLCSGGILGLGEEVRDRAELLAELASMDPTPESVPINTLVPIEGTPLAGSDPVDWSELVRVVAAARILMPHSAIRLSAGREGLGEAVQALCFLAGANSIFVGDELLTAPNAPREEDAGLFAKLGLEPLSRADRRS